MLPNREPLNATLGCVAVVVSVAVLAAVGVQAQVIESPAERVRQQAINDPTNARLEARKLQALHPADEALLLELIKLEERHQNLPALREAVRSAMARAMVKPYGPPETIWRAVSAAWLKGEAWEDLESAALEVLIKHPFYYAAKHDLVRARVMKADFTGAAAAMEGFPAPPWPRLQAKPGAGAARIPAFMLYLAAGELQAALKALPMPDPNVSYDHLAESAAIKAWAAPAKERAEALEQAGRRVAYGALTPPLPLADYFAYVQPTHEKLWKEIARRYPDCFPAFCYAGIWAGAGGRSIEAEKLVRQAAALKPDWALPHRLLAGYYHSRGDVWRSQAEAERAGELLGYYHWNSNDPPPRPPQQLLDAKNYLEGADAAARGKLKQADQRLSDVIGYPYQMPAIRLRGAILAAMGNEHYARQLLETYRPNPLPPRQTLEQFTGDHELFPSPPRRFRDPGAEPTQERPKPFDFRLQLVRWIGFGFPRHGSAGGVPSSDTHRTADCIEILLRAVARDGKDQTARLWYGMWLLRSDEMWPTGDPRQTDAKRIREGKKLLENFLDKNPGDPRAVEPLRRLGEREKKPAPR